ncbi:unnamed protein product, partial [Mesorhabditis spiculigera]
MATEQQPKEEPEPHLPKEEQEPAFKMVLDPPAYLHRLWNPNGVDAEVILKNTTDARQIFKVKLVGYTRNSLVLFSLLIGLPMVVITLWLLTASTTGPAEPGRLGRAARRKESQGLCGTSKLKKDEGEGELVHDDAAVCRLSPRKGRHTHQGIDQLCRECIPTVRKAILSGDDGRHGWRCETLAAYQENIGEDENYKVMLVAICPKCMLAQLGHDISAGQEGNTSRVNADTSGSDTE